MSETGILELKYNPWHDPDDGKFTHEGQGRHFGGGGASGSWDGPPPKKTGRSSFGGRGASGPWGKPKIQTGGGSFGGGGASGSWDKPKPKAGGGSIDGGGASGSWDEPTPAKPVPKVQQPKREIVKPTISRTATRLPKPRAATRKISKGGYNFEADAQDRTIRASGQLRLQPDQPRSRTQQRNAGKPDRLANDHGGHFIAREFGGPEISYNHFAQNARFNVRGYRELERNWKSNLKAGKKVKVDVRALYEGGSKRPSKINVTYYVNGERFFKPFENKKRGQ
ncbi:DNA/RNA non-specific endonuclease [Sphingorhabdus sp.]|uniref:DNA/RNA non-specific endonuclease n=1 Tax=Sphingorhabdus sp. TaxID=1902408 RepID=UPI0032B70134